MATNPPIIVAVAAIIENTEGQMLLIKRASHKSNPGFWEDVGGRLEPKENPKNGLLREIKEETGLCDIEIIKPLSVFHTYLDNQKKSKNELFGISYWCRTKTTEITLSDEHTEYKWVYPLEALLLTKHEALKNYIQIYLKELLKEDVNQLELGE